MRAQPTAANAINVSRCHWPKSPRGRARVALKVGLGRQLPEVKFHATKTEAILTVELFTGHHWIHAGRISAAIVERFSKRRR